MQRLCRDRNNTITRNIHFVNLESFWRRQAAQATGYRRTETKRFVNDVVEIADLLDFFVGPVGITVREVFIKQSLEFFEDAWVTSKEVQRVGKSIGGGITCNR